MEATEGIRCEGIEHVWWLDRKAERSHHGSGMGGDRSPWEMVPVGGDAHRKRAGVAGRQLGVVRGSPAAHLVGAEGCRLEAAPASGSGGAM